MFSTLFVALEPDGEFCTVIQEYKRQVRALVGPQLYLEDPPHLTVYLALFASVDTVLEAAAAVAAKIAMPLVEITGWHVFEADPLTGNHTLVCQIDDEGQHRLRAIQRDTIATLAPLRASQPTEERLQPRAGGLSDEQWRSVSAVGFPYVESGWHPHFTIASIGRDDWARVANQLLPQPPTAHVTCPSLKAYQLVDERPILLASWALSPNSNASDAQQE